MSSIFQTLAKKILIFPKTPASKSDYLPLEDYGIVGNLETAALVGKNGSIDWLCLPHLESESVFAALLDKNKGGFFSIRPRLKFKSVQKYLENTNILVTEFSTGTGKAEIVDFMPPFKKRKVWHRHQAFFRLVKCKKGVVTFHANFQPRFGYGLAKNSIKLTESGIAAESKTEKIFLDSPFPFEIFGQNAQSFFTLAAGEQAWFSLQYDTRQYFSPKQYSQQLAQTKKYWENWAHKCKKEQCVFRGPWHDLAVRSGLVLKLLTHGETGSIAAAATTSLPETLGGSRNWDYRFNWIRDSAFTAQALYNLGHKTEAKALFNWYKKIYKNTPAKNIPPLSGMHGEVPKKDRVLKNLSGYENSRPVRVGNTAFAQSQLDIYGELINAAFETNRYGDKISKNDWRLICSLAEFVRKNWTKKDSGIWEIRGKKQHYVYSKVMCWAALDKAEKIAEMKNLPAPVKAWAKEKNKIKTDILEKGFNPGLNSFTQSYGSAYLDAANLLIPFTGFLPPEDPKIVGTLKATQKYLQKNELVMRYNSPDGLKGEEGAFLLCSFWLADCLAISGQAKESEDLLKKLAKKISPTGLYAEQVDKKTGRMLGNFPQAFSHVGLINSVLYLGLAKGRSGAGVKPLSSIAINFDYFKKQIAKTFDLFGI